MLHIAVLSPRKEVQEQLNSLCSHFLSKDYAIERFSSSKAAADYFNRHDPDLALIDAEIGDTNPIHFVTELQLREHLCRIVLVQNRDRNWSDLSERAIEIGISDCIFFPFSPEELSFLFLSTRNRTALLEGSELRLARSIRALRDSFMDCFIGSDSFADSTIANLNAKYRVNLSNGIFQVAILSFPGLTDELEHERYRLMLGSIVTEARQVLDPVCFEMIPLVRGFSTIILVANYAISRSIRRQLESLWDIVCKNTALHCGFELPFVIGVGTPEYDSIYLRRAFQSAQYGLRCQLLFGRNKIFFYDDYSFSPVSLESEPILTDLNHLSKHAEMLDAKSVSYTIYKLMSQLGTQPDPADISSLCNQISSTIVSALRKNMQLSEKATKLSEISRFLNMEFSLNGLTAALSSWAKELIDYCLQIQKQIMLRPIREAKLYIDQNYAQHLTLKSISQKVDLSPAYFCTLFKQEVGDAFNSYLSNIRIEHAKKLLAGTDLSITSISERVGYQDPRYFSRIFLKTVGVQPTAYRKLHGRSSEIVVEH